MERIVMTRKKIKAGETILQGCGKNAFGSVFPPRPHMMNIVAIMMPKQLWQIGM